MIKMRDILSFKLSRKILEGRSTLCTATPCRVGFLHYLGTTEHNCRGLNIGGEPFPSPPNKHTHWIELCTL